MESIKPGELVRVSGEGPDLDGIVFDTPSARKIVVAVVGAQRGPGFRTVDPKALSERSEKGPDDQALRLLIRRTPPPVRGGTGREGGGVHGRAGHARTAMHRTTGK